MLLMSIGNRLATTECSYFDGRHVTLRCNIAMTGPTKKTAHRYLELLVCVLRLHDMLRFRA
ncbi:hypothetical protein M378DRAFT_163105, partial [Amanita muscaria Koide BX008]